MQAWSDFKGESVGANPDADRSALVAGITVASPVEYYFLYIEDLEEPERSVAKAATEPLLDALGAAYATPADGTAFYRLQSCANHSCAPNAHTLKVRCRYIEISLIGYARCG